MIELKEIQQAQRLLQKLIDPSPLIRSFYLSETTGLEVRLKLENLQKTGSFKIRGAYNKIGLLSEEERKRGVITASAGNHGQGVAFAASLYGIDSLIIMPEKCPLNKVSAVKAAGGKIILHGENFDDCYSYAMGLKNSTGMTFIHGFDDPQVIAGQGTIGLEILKQLPEVDNIIVPVGGGGLIAGIAIAVKALRPDTVITGVEAAKAPSMYLSLQQGAIVSLSQAESIADGIAVKKVGTLPFAIVGKLVDEVITLEEEEIAAAILVLMEKEKLVAEGAGAVSVGALLFHAEKIKGHKVVALISGGNIDVNMMERIIERGLIKTGRLMRLSVDLPDTPGSLARLAAILAEKKTNILQIFHNRLDTKLPLGRARVELYLEARGHDHVKEIVEALAEGDYLTQQL